MGVFGKIRSQKLRPRKLFSDSWPRVEFSEIFVKERSKFGNSCLEKCNFSDFDREKNLVEKWPKLGNFCAENASSLHF